MKRFTSIEIGGLILAALLFFGGLCCVLTPRAGVVIHSTNDEIGWPGGSIESVSKIGSRVYGIMAMLLAFGIAALALYRRKV